MKNYLLCVTKSVEKIVGIRARNEKESREKVVKQIVDGTTMQIKMKFIMK